MATNKKPNGPLKNLLPTNNVVDFAEARRSRLDSIRSIGTRSSNSGKSQEYSTDIFKEFIQQSQRREELLKDATDEQIKIFNRLESVIAKLASASHTDSKELKNSIDALAKQLAATPKTKAKQNIEKTLPRPKTGIEGMPNGMWSNYLNWAKTGDIKRSYNREPLSPMGYSLYEDASTVQSIEPKQGKSLVDALLEGDNDDGNGPTIIPRLGPNGKPIIPKTTPKGNPYRDKKTGKYRSPTWWEKTKAGKTKLGRAAKAAGKIGSRLPIVAPLISGGMYGYDEYQRSGSLGKALAVGGGSAIAGEIAAAAGGFVGSAAGPLGTFAGATAGGYYGSEAGANFVRGIVESPALTEQPANTQSMQQETQRNQQLKEKTPKVEVLQPTILTSPSQQQQSGTSFLMPRADTRSNENAFVRARDSNAFFM
jgi:polyhydroxyalkanoate synthesis regulator phasin